MSKDNTPKLPPLPDDGSRAEAGRARREAAAQALRDQKKAARRRRVLVQIAVGLVVVLVGVGITVLALNSGDDDATVAADVPASGIPAQVNADGAYVTGAKKPKVTIQVVEDFQCPICQQFEQVSGSLLDEYISGDVVQVQYRTIAFLDRMSSTEYSTRALNASACVMPAGEDVWRRFHTALFANQPPEQGDGLPDETLISLAEQAGAPDSVASCITDQPYRAWTASTTQAAFDAGVTGTPTIFVNGTKLDAFTPDVIKAAVDKALAK
ncbi:DsbA family protein [Nocardioides fonticola]|uniref:DsbA family protein n=1 Tax=Nocardioides fonticola TaxID=450363 RepID=A0ABP7XAX5_9ACTN